MEKRTIQFKVQADGKIALERTIYSVIENFN